MISEERLREIFDKKGDLYDKDAYHIDLTDREFFITEDTYEEVSLVDEYENVWYLSDLYDNKEEAEFVANYHCSKTIKFEPPTFEEFEKSTGELNNEYPHYETDRLCIMDCFYANEIQVFTYPENDYGRPQFEYKDNIESKKQAYYQAVEYAKKLFLGEE